MWPCTGTPLCFPFSSFATYPRCGLAPERRYGAISNLGVLLTTMSRPEQAVERFHEALSLPGLSEEQQAQVYYHMGQALSSMGKLVEAKETLEISKSLAPSYFRTYSALLSIMKSDPGTPRVEWVSMMEQIEAQIDSLLSASPALAEFLHEVEPHILERGTSELVASHLAAQGEARLAVGAHGPEGGSGETSDGNVAVLPELAAYNFGLFTVLDHLASKAESMAGTTRTGGDETDGSRRDEVVARLQGDEQSHVEAAWRHLVLGNALEQARRPRSNVALEERQAGIYAQVFHPGFWTPGVGIPDRTPIFIVGMMRSGSSLVEQILSAHSQVHGIGEDSIFNGRLALARDAIVAAVGSGDQGAVARTVAHHANGITKAMRGRVPESKRSEIKHVVDKMLFNYRNIGFIHLLFPHAPIIHCVRGFWDVLFSCYRHKFEDAGLEWSMSVADLVRYLAAYRRFMRHWEKVLPGRVLHVQYEDLVSSPETSMRRILDHCGLPWQEQVLRFHKASDTVVHTFSAQQVRSQIYSHAVASSKRYYSLLRQLAEQSPGFEAIRDVVSGGYSGQSDWVTDRARISEAASVAPQPSTTQLAGATSGFEGAPSLHGDDSPEAEGEHSPQQQRSIEALRKRIKEALVDEDFEEATVLKRALRALQQPAPSGAAAAATTHP